MANQKKNLKEYYDDGNLDLSLSGIQDVPVRDIVSTSFIYYLFILLKCLTVSLV